MKILGISDNLLFMPVEGSTALLGSFSQESTLIMRNQTYTRFDLFVSYPVIKISISAWTRRHCLVVSNQVFFLAIFLLSTVVLIGARGISLCLG